MKPLSPEQVIKGREYANEYQLHKAVVEWLQQQYSHILFRSDLGGVKLPMGLAMKMKALNPRKGYPDLFIIEPTKHYKGLFIEIKMKDFKEFKKDGINYVSDHVEEQAEYLIELHQRGYCAVFGRGFQEIQFIIENYLGEFN